MLGEQDDDLIVVTLLDGGDQGWRFRVAALSPQHFRAAASAPRRRVLVRKVGTR
jgi:hypothetical protein